MSTKKIHPLVKGPMTANAKQLTKIRNLNKDKVELRAKLEGCHSRILDLRRAASTLALRHRMFREDTKLALVNILSREIEEANMLADITGNQRFVAFADRMSLVRARVIKAFSEPLTMCMNADMAEDEEDADAAD